MSNAALETAKYRGDPVLFVQDFGLSGEFPAFQAHMIRQLSQAFSAGVVTVPELRMRFGAPGIRSRSSRGWRRHVRRMKAARR